MHHRENSENILYLLVSSTKYKVFPGIPGRHKLRSLFWFLILTLSSTPCTDCQPINADEDIDNRRMHHHWRYTYTSTIDSKVDCHTVGIINYSFFLQLRPNLHKLAHQNPLKISDSSLRLHIFFKLFIHLIVDWNKTRPFKLRFWISDFCTKFGKFHAYV